MPAGPLRPDDPERLGAYRVLGRLGEGAQGAVFLGAAPDGTSVAVKLLHRGLVADADARARFLREASAAERVARFCTAQVLDADASGEAPYIVSEYVEGRSLRDLVRAEGPRAGGALERLAIGTATALAAIHRAGIVHRDFKPHNVLIGSDGPRVIDFGVAKALGASATTSSQAVGTPSYMAPEQLAGAELGPPVDLFAWAVTMSYAATGSPAFGDDTIPAVMHRVLYEEPNLPPLPGPLGELVRACLAKDPAARPTAQRVLLALVGEESPRGAGAETTATLPHVPVPAAVPEGSPTEATRPMRSRRGWVVPAVAAGAAALAALLAVPLVSYASDDGPDTGPPHPAAVRTTPTRAPRETPATPSTTPERTPSKPTGATRGAGQVKPTEKPEPKQGRSCAGSRTITVGGHRLSGQYCNAWVPGGGIPVYARRDAGSAVVGRLYQGGTANWFVGQASGGRYRHGKWWNTHWAYTLSDGTNGKWGWVPIVYFRGGDNGAADATLKPCGNRCHPY